MYKIELFLKPRRFFILLFVVGLVSILFAGRLNVRSNWTKNREKNADTRIFDYIPHQTHTVAEGETISSIASLYRIHPDTIMAANSLEQITSLVVGESLILLQEDGIIYKPKYYDTYRSIAKRFDISFSDFLEVNQLEGFDDEISQPQRYLFLPSIRFSARKEEARWKGFLSWPIYADQIQPFGERLDPYTDLKREEAGVIFRGAKEGDVWAPAPGEIEKIALDPYYGRYLVIDHRDGYKSFLAHLSQINVGVNESVERFETLGKVGEIGKVGWIGVEYLLFYEGDLINPIPHLR